MRIVMELVASAVREIPKAWRQIDLLHIVVSIDGLQPEHDERRKPATYERILKNIEGHRIKVHCTVTGQTAGREGYYEEFLDFWSARPEVERIWFSLFTPQVGAVGDEILTPAARERIVSELAGLRGKFLKLTLP